MFSKIVIALSVSCMLVCEVANANLNCEILLKKHGFLSRAQFQCNYEDYNEELLQLSKYCFDQIDNEKRSMKFIGIGMSMFDDLEKSKGRKQACKNVLNTFPESVR